MKNYTPRNHSRLIDTYFFNDNNVAYNINLEIQQPHGCMPIDYIYYFDFKKALSFFFDATFNSSLSSQDYLFVDMTLSETVERLLNKKNVLLKSTSDRVISNYFYIDNSFCQVLNLNCVNVLSELLEEIFVASMVQSFLASFLFIPVGLLSININKIHMDVRNVELYNGNYSSYYVDALAPVSNKDISTIRSVVNQIKYIRDSELLSRVKTIHKSYQDLIYALRCFYGDYDFYYNKIKNNKAIKFALRYSDVT